MVEAPQEEHKGTRSFLPLPQAAFKKNSQTAAPDSVGKREKERGQTKQGTIATSDT